MRHGACLSVHASRRPGAGGRAWEDGRAGGGERPAGGCLFPDPRGRSGSPVRSGPAGGGPDATRPAVRAKDEREGGRRDPQPRGVLAPPGLGGGLCGIGRQHGSHHEPGRGAAVHPACQAVSLYRAGAEDFPPAPAGPPCGAGRPGGDRAPGLRRRLVPAPSGSAPPSPASPPARGSPGPDWWKRKGGPEAAAQSGVNRGSVLRRAARLREAGFREAGRHPRTKPLDLALLRALRPAGLSLRQVGRRRGVSPATTVSRLRLPPPPAHLTGRRPSSKMPPGPGTDFRDGSGDGWRHGDHQEV